jgi:hypothetical protein
MISDKNTSRQIDRLVEKLGDCCENKNYQHYQELVEGNWEILKGIEMDFFREIFFEGDKKEIEFWIDFLPRTLSIHDLSLIPFKYDDLFYKGLQRVDLIFDCLEDLEKYLEDLFEDMDELEKSKMSLRIEGMKKHSNFPSDMTNKFANFYSP